MRLVAVLFAVVLIITTNGISGCSSSPKLNLQDEEKERRFIGNLITKKKLVRANPYKMRNIKRMLCEISRTAGLKKCVQAEFLEVTGYPRSYGRTVTIPSSVLSLSKEDIYFLLGHEVAHISLGHTKNKNSDQMIHEIKLVLSSYTGLFGDSHKSLSGAMNFSSMLLKGVKERDLIRNNDKLKAILAIVALTSFVVGSKLAVEEPLYYIYDKKKEYAADIKSIEIMRKNNISTKNLIVFLKKLEKEYDTKRNTFRNTHPSFKDRTSLLKKYINHN